MAENQLELSVSEFVAYANQTLEYAYPSVVITGELANFRVSKNKWVYFDLKDDEASLRFFGTVYLLRGPLEDGMMLKVRGTPRLHPQYGFSITVQQLELVGEGTIRRAAKLLEAKLQQEGLFDTSRKRKLPYPPKRIGLITSTESAAYADFTKILQARWGGLEIEVCDVQVQGMQAPMQIIEAIQTLNQLPEPPEVLVVIRGGGSAEDLQAFSEENVVRAVASSRVPTLVAIGHEIDVSLAELAADVRGSTPSNAAELLVPDRAQVRAALGQQQRELSAAVLRSLARCKEHITRQKELLTSMTTQSIADAKRYLQYRHDVLEAYNPNHVLQRGYALVRESGNIVTDATKLTPGAIVDIETARAELRAKITHIKPKKGKL